MAQDEKIRVLVVDDDLSFIEAVQVMLADDERLEVVGGATNGQEAIEQAAALRPEVVAMDVAMPGMDGIEAAKTILEAQPGCHVILVSGSIFLDHGDEGVEAARAAGASAYVVKSRAVIDLADTVVAVAQTDPLPSTA